MANSGKKTVLFVCLGNICRSPIAEAVFRQLVIKEGKEHEWEIDSAAVGPYHIGLKSERRAQQTAKKFGTPMDHTVRQVNKQDFYKFQYIFGFDLDNISDLTGMKPKDSNTTVELLGSYDPNNKSQNIDDPYYGDNIEDFEEVYHQCVAACKNFLAKH
ncbi:low molecular weight phosphotyrosine protein phosphatase-like [Lineus longissimus]|uniref:low molecular weight phosphotyrosine protein phosphatase-like n=1 Tax=Lineus longissimus TaxID=88925 RepID=UPI00315C71CD